MSFKVNTRYRHRRRAGEPWVSNNRVLNGGASKKNGAVFGRNPNFDTDETKLLIQLWGDPKIQRTLITTHKKHAVICQLSNKMRAYGYNRSAEEITTRIKNLKCFYNRLKKDMDTGHVPATEPSWKHFHEMDAIMTRPIFSVRPNEIPAPSLKYQLEKEREERAERRKRAEDSGAYCDNEEIHLTADRPETFTGVNSKNRRISSKREIDIVPDVEVAINDETFVAIANAAKQSAAVASKKHHSAKTNEHLDELQQNVSIKSEQESCDLDEDSDVVSPTLQGNKDGIDAENVGLVPKIEPEPINVDSDEEVTMRLEQSAMPTVSATTLSELFHLSQGTIMPAHQSSLTNSTTNSSTLQPITANTNICSTMAKPIFTTTTTITTTASAISTTTTTCGSTVSQLHGKISLVPTNFLMQQPRVVPSKSALAQPATSSSAQLNLLQTAINAQNHNVGAPLQSRILLSGTQANTSPTNTTTGIVTTVPGGMKVLLVNADQAAAAAANGMRVTSSSSANIMTNKSTAIGTVLPQQLQQLQHQIQQQQQQQQQQKAGIEQQESKLKEQRDNAKNKRDDMISKREATGIRLLLRQLLNAQTESNDIQHQRLTLERERLDFEKCIAERFLAALPNVFNAQSAMKSTPPTLVQQPQPILTNTTIRLPPKLVFTTTTAGCTTPTTILSTTPASTTVVSAAAAACLQKSNLVTNITSTAATVKPTIEICSQVLKPLKLEEELT